MGRARRQPAKLLHDDRADVVALPRNERPLGVLHEDHAAQERMLHRRLAGDTEERHLRFRSVQGFSGTSEAHGKFVVPMSIQPFAVSMPVMCMPWQVAQVRLVGLPRPTEFRCIESLIQNVRNMNTSCPRAMDSRAALRAFNFAPDQ